MPEPNTKPSQPHGCEGFRRARVSPKPRRQDRPHRARDAAPHAQRRGRRTLSMGGHRCALQDSPHAGCGRWRRGRQPSGSSCTRGSPGALGIAIGSPVRLERAEPAQVVGILYDRHQFLGERLAVVVGLAVAELILAHTRVNDPVPGMVMGRGVRAPRPKKRLAGAACPYCPGQGIPTRGRPSPRARPHPRQGHGLPSRSPRTSTPRSTRPPAAPPPRRAPTTPSERRR